MTRITFTIAAAAVAASALFTSVAEACISCNYVPEVVHTKPRYPQGLTARPTPKRIARQAPTRKAPKKVEIAKAATPKKSVIAKAPEPTKPIETASTEPAKSTDTATPATSTEPREKPISTATLLEGGGARQPTEETKDSVQAEATCKKFFPAVGMTLTVPCG